MLKKEGDLVANKSIKENAVYNAIKTGSTILFPFITFPYVSRTLMSESIGKVNFSASIVSYFALIASLGISTYAIRECASVREDKTSLDKLASQIFSINVCTTIVSYLALFITLLLFRRLDNYRTLIVIQSLSILFTTLGVDWINSAVEDFKYITLRTVAFQLLSLALLFLFIHNPEDYIKYSFISLISSSGASLVNIWYRRKYCSIKFTTHIDWEKHLKPIMLLFVMILAHDIFANVDSTMLGLIQGDRAVGLYTTAQRINRIVSQVIGSVLWVIMPRMSLYFAEKNYDEINRLLRKLLGFNFLVGLPCVTGLIVLSNDIVLLMAGSDFVEASPILKIRALSLLFSLLGGNLLGNAILLPSKQEKYYMTVCIVTAFINIITNYLLIPHWGPIGAAITTAFCSLCILVMLLFRVDKNIKIKNVGRLIVSPIVGCAGIVVVCFVMSYINSLIIRTLLSIAFSVLIYVAIQYALKNELISELLASVIRRRKNIERN